MMPVTIADLELDIRDAIDRDDEHLVASLGAELDRLDVHPDTVPVLSAALWYASVGLKVFPLMPKAKIPYKGTHGFEDASDDPDEVRGLFDGKPDANVGIATGHLVDVVDIDGPIGVASWVHELIDDPGFPSVLGKVSTPRPGGAHLYVPAEPGHGNRAAMLPGIDYRGLGGYVVTAPSTTDQGAYVWVRPLTLP